MFWGKKKIDDGRPIQISGALARLIGDEWGKLPRSGDHWAVYLAVLRPRENNGGDSDVRIFDKWHADDKKVEVLNYASLDQFPDLILLEGWFNQKTKKGEIKAVTKL